MVELNKGKVSSGQPGLGVHETKRPKLLSRLPKTHERRAVGEHQDQEAATIRLDSRIAEFDPLAIAYLEIDWPNRQPTPFEPYPVEAERS